MNGVILGVFARLGLDVLVLGGVEKPLDGEVVLDTRIGGRWWLACALVVGCLALLQVTLASATAALKQSRQLQNNLNLLLEAVLRKFFGTHTHRLAIVPNSVPIVDMVQGVLDLRCRAQWWLRHRVFRLLLLGDRVIIVDRSRMDCVNGHMVVVEGHRGGGGDGRSCCCCGHLEKR